MREAWTDREPSGWVALKMSVFYHGEVRWDSRISLGISVTLHTQTPVSLGSVGLAAGLQSLSGQRWALWG